jgi:hypothetical protein
MGMPEHSGRATIQRERLRLATQSTPFGPLVAPVPVTDKRGKATSISIQNPYAFLWLAGQQPSDFAETLRSTLDESSDTVSLLFYADEINCGRATADVKTREIMAVYWSIAEFGPLNLSQELFWFTLTTLRTHTINRMAGGFMQIATICLKELLLPLKNGLVFTLPSGNSRVLTGRLAIVVQDERAHKSAFGLKGATGTKFCALCMKYVDIKSTLLPDPTNFLIRGSSIPLDRTQLHSNATVRAVMSRLTDVASRADSSTELATLQQELGFLYSPYSPLLDHDLSLDFVSVFVWDWLHCHLASGVFSNEIEELAHRLDAYDLGGKTMCTYCNAFVWPRAYASGHLVFRPAEGSVDYAPSGTASEFMSVAPVLGKFLLSVVVPEGACSAEAQSMLALIDVIELLAVASYGKLADPGILERAVTAHLTLQSAAYGEELWKPKMHFVLHLADQLQRHGFLPGVAVQERKHRVVKRRARDRHGDRSFDHGVLTEVTVQHLHEIGLPFKGSVLDDARNAPPRLCAAIVASGYARDSDSIMTSRIARVQSRAVTMGDVVLYMEGSDVSVGEVYFHASINGMAHSCVSKWPVEFCDTHTKHCRVADDPRIVPTHLLLESVVYSKASVGSVSHVLVPVLRR